MTTRTRGELAQLRHAMRRMRGQYMENVRKGKCKHNPKALAEFDAELEKMNEQARVSSQHQSAR